MARTLFCLIFNKLERVQNYPCVCLHVYPAILVFLVHLDFCDMLVSKSSFHHLQALRPVTDSDQLLSHEVIKRCFAVKIVFSSNTTLHDRKHIIVCRTHYQLILCSTFWKEKLSHLAHKLPDAALVTTS